MTQDDINFQEWSNPDNWSEGLFRVYFSKKDSRVFVPGTRNRIDPRIPAGFWSTINYGHPRGPTWSLILLLIVGVAVFGAGLTANLLR